MISAIKISRVWLNPMVRDCTYAVVRSFMCDVILFMPAIGRLICFVGSCNFFAKPVVMKFAWEQESSSTRQEVRRQSRSKILMTPVAKSTRGSS